MSSVELLKFLEGEDLFNTTKHKAKTDSVGFCFFAIDDVTPEYAWKFLRGAIFPDVCVVFEVNDMYLKKGDLKACLLGEGYTWFDTGTFDSLIDAANMIRTIQNNRDGVICCPEYISYMNRWLSSDDLEKRAELLKKNSYGGYLKKVLNKRK